jgi:hypothetical protein
MTQLAAALLNLFSPPIYFYAVAQKFKLPLLSNIVEEDDIEPLKRKLHICRKGDALRFKSNVKITSRP